jgi:diacylglycerol kinase (ATP)
LPGFIVNESAMSEISRSPQKLFLIFNPHASFGRAKKLLPKIIEVFKAKGFQLEVCLTEYPKHATEVIRDLNLSGYDGIVVAGGDGTLFEVVNGYMRNKSEKRIPIGVVPVGTGNAFVRDLDLRTNDYNEAINIICSNKPQGTDVAEFVTNAETHYFINILGMGFITDVQKIAFKLKFLGNLSYTLGVLYQIIFLKKYKFRLEMDDKVLEGRNIFIEISNTRYTSNFLMAPDASFDDGLLDITVLNPMPRLRMLRYFPSIFTGKHIHKRGIDTYKAKHIRISTLKTKALAPDGEIFGSAPLEVKCLHKAVLVYRR